MFDVVAGSKVGGFIVGIFGAIIGAIGSAMGISYKRGKKDAMIQEAIAKVEAQSVKNETSINKVEEDVSDLKNTVTRLDERSESHSHSMDRIETGLDDVKKILMKDVNKG